MNVSEMLLAEMSVPDAPLRRVAMPWVEFLELPDELFAEWVDGEAVVSPRPTQLHAAAVMRLGATLLAALPGLEVLAEGGVRLPGDRLRGPDVMAVAGTLEKRWAEDPPVLVVEVLSPSTRSEDLLRKAPEYAAAGIGQYWVVDPEHRTIEVFENTDGAWAPLLRLDDEHPAGEVAVGDHGVVPVDLAQILRH